MKEPVGSYFLFSQNTENKIKKGPYGGTVTVETPRWLSFQGYVMDALASRPDVTLNVKFREKGYKGGEFKTVTIPAGYDAASLKDANGYTGFLYLVWMIAIRERFVTPRIRYLFYSIAVLLLFLHFEQTLKYDIYYDNADISRWLWYSYYIPFTLIPYISFVISLLVDKKENKIEASMIVPGIISFFTRGAHHVK